jgi:hypothetical protein
MNEPENGEYADLIDQAAQYADEWYESNPMPCGSTSGTEAYHHSCRANVESRCRSTLGTIGFLTIIYYLTQICYTVWQWRHSEKK